MPQLLPYQVEGVLYALARRGTIIADEMGLGKTAQAIGVINADPSLERILIVCPVGLKLNWWKELDQWLTRKPVISVIGYTEMHKVSGPPVDLLIFDEAQYIKNESAQRTQNAKALASKARKVIALTGTPIENRISDLWPLLTITAPDYWNPQKPPRNFLKPLPSAVVLTSHKPVRERTMTEQNLWKFKMRYCGPVKKTFYKKGRKKVAYEFKGGSNLPELYKRLRESCLIRRLKKDVLKDLPPKVREIVTYPTPLNDIDQAPLLVGHWHQQLTVENYDTMVAKLTSNKVAFQEWSRVRHMQGVTKVPYVVEHVERALEQVPKIILFAHHEDVVLDLKMRIPKSVMVTGQTPTEARQKAVERFQKDPDIQVFIGSIRAAGVGLTLTAASVVIFAEIDPNPAAMNQAEDRAHRIGQRDSVLVQYLVADGSIDARLCAILAIKQDLARAALTDSAKG